MPVRLKLQQSDRRERRGIMAALDQAHCLLWFDPQGRVIDANPNIQALLGADLDHLSTWTYADVTAGSTGSESYLKEHWGRIIAGDLRAEERDVITAEGARLWCSLTHAPIKSAEGEVKLVFTMLIDLSPWNKSPKEGLRRLF